MSKFHRKILGQKMLKARAFLKSIADSSTILLIDNPGELEKWQIATNGMLGSGF